MNTEMNTEMNTRYLDTTQDRPEPDQSSTPALEDAEDAEDATRASQSPAERILCQSLGYPSAVEP